VGYHVDFVLCEPRTTRPVLVVELDDRRHRQPGRARLDAWKDTALSAAGVPVLRVEARGAYDAGELARQIEDRGRASTGEARR
jgi:very-short-patch-repair endonuclease